MMVASLGGVLKTILWIFIISGIIRFVVRLTANYAVNKVNEDNTIQLEVSPGSYLKIEKSSISLEWSKTNPK